MAQDESDAISALTGISLNQVLDGLSLPAGARLTNRLGIAGIPSLTQSQIYSDKWDDEDVVGPDQGEDWEDQIDKEMREEEEEEEGSVKKEADSPDALKKQRRVRTIKRLVERPKSVYERFPTFDRNTILDFTQLFKGYTAPKSRLVKRAFQRKCYVFTSKASGLNLSVETHYPRKKETIKNFLESVVGDTRREVENKRVEEVVSAGNVESDLRQALEVRPVAFCQPYCNNKSQLGTLQIKCAGRYAPPRSFIRPRPLV